MAKIGATIRCYHLTKYLKAVIKQYLWCDKVLVLNYRFPNVKESPDDTKKICDEMGVECISGENLKQHNIFNLGLHGLRDFDSVFVADADEFITRQDQDELIRFGKGRDFVMCKLIDYIDFDHALQMRTHHPIVLADPKRCEFTDVRNAGGNAYTTDAVTMHHFGYAWKDEDLDWKYKNKWYEDFNRILAQGVEPADCPQEIRSLING